MSERTSSARGKHSPTRKNGNGGASVDDIQADLQSLHEDLSRLTGQIGDLLSSKESAVWQRAMAGIDEVISSATAKKDQATDALHDVSERLSGAVDEAITTRPYATLAAAAVLGFAFGTAWRR